MKNFKMFSQETPSTHLTVVYFGLHDANHQLFLHRGRDSETAAHPYSLTLGIRIHHLHGSIQDY